MKDGLDEGGSGDSGELSGQLHARDADEVWIEN